MWKQLAGIFMLIATCSWVYADVSECIGKCSTHTSVDSPVNFLPHENCNKYCVCDFGKPIEMPCPSGLHFAPKWNTCANPTIAECTGYDPEFSMNAVQTEKENDLIFIDNCIGKCPVQENLGQIILLAHVDPKIYCRCRNGRPIIKNCAEGYIFDLKNGTCMPQNDQTIQH